MPRSMKYRNNSFFSLNTLAPLVFTVTALSGLLIALMFGNAAYAQSGDCESGTVETGTLTEFNYYQYLPAGEYYYYAEGPQNGCLSGPAGTNFQLLLLEWSATERRWIEVGRSENPGSEESIRYDAKDTYYSWYVYTAEGYGDYQFTLSDAEPPTEPVCIANRIVDSSWANQEFIGRIRPGDVGSNVAIDLRGTTIHVHDQPQDAVDGNRPVIDSRWGLVQIDSATDLCVVGGKVISPNPYNITWFENYDRDGIGKGYRLGTTRNHVGVDLGGAQRPVVTGLYFFNLHDGVRYNSASDWRLEHTWGEYTRDDCIENDQMASGVIHDVLLDGCYAGYSNRATSLVSDDGTAITGIDKTVTFDKVLLRMEMMPGPYDACGRPQLYFDNTRTPYTASPCVERDVYGTGALFKLYDQKNPTGGINPTFNLIDSFFVVEQVRDSSGETRADFPPTNKIGVCENVTILYLGEGPYPGRLPPEGCYTLYAEDNREQGLALWREKVAQWQDNHPDIAPERKKPALYGDVTFPRPPFNEGVR